MANPQWWPVDDVRITGEWNADAAWYQEHVGQLGHNGIDLGGAWGTPLYAVDDGVVVQAGNNIPWSGPAGGTALMIRSSWGHYGMAHCSSLQVGLGATVSRGQRLASMGNTGLALGVHCHLDTLPLNPYFGNGYSGRVNPRAIINLQPRGAGTSGSIIPIKEEEEMAKNSGTYYKRSSDGEYVFVISNTESGYYSERIGIIGDRDYQIRLAAAFDVGGNGFFLMSESDARVHREACAQVLAGKK